jgi:hypothetical protein
MIQRIWWRGEDDGGSWVKRTDTNWRNHVTGVKFPGRDPPGFLSSKLCLFLVLGNPRITQFLFQWIMYSTASVLFLLPIFSHWQHHLCIHWLFIWSFHVDIPIPSSTCHTLRGLYQRKFPIMPMSWIIVKYYFLNEPKSHWVVLSLSLSCFYFLYRKLWEGSVLLIAQ